MILDTSAVIAILNREPEADRFLDLIDRDAAPKMSIANYFEAGIVIDSARDANFSRRLDTLLQMLCVELHPVTVEQGKLAREAYRDFGKGRSHPARLNFGDCFAYALAKELGEPLLFKGSDFGATDIESGDQP